MDDTHTFDGLSLYEIGVYFRDLHHSRTPELEYRNVKILLEKHLGELLTAHTTYIRHPDGVDTMTIHCPSAQSQTAIASIISQTSEHLINEQGIHVDDVPSIITHGSDFNIAIHGEHAEAYMCKLMEHIHTAKVAQNPHQTEEGQNDTARVMSELNFRSVYQLLSHFKARGSRGEIDMG